MSRLFCCSHRGTDDLCGKRRADDQCLYGVIGYPTIFNFSVATQQTIGECASHERLLLHKYVNFHDCLHLHVLFTIALVPCTYAGYGNTGPNNCAWASLVLVIQTIFGLLLDAITIGVLFARISHPQQRARSVGVPQQLTCDVLPGSRPEVGGRLPQRYTSRLCCAADLHVGDGGHRPA